MLMVAHDGCHIRRHDTKPEKQAVVLVRCRAVGGAVHGLMGFEIAGSCHLCTSSGGRKHPRLRKAPQRHLL
jgi:hypothetical protein